MCIFFHLCFALNINMVHIEQFSQTTRRPRWSHSSLELPAQIPTHSSDPPCTCYPRSVSVLLACASVLLSGLFGDPAPPASLCEVTQRARSQRSQHVV